MWILTSNTATAQQNVSRDAELFVGNAAAGLL
jgi:hypothetical protein